MTTLHGGFYCTHFADGHAQCKRHLREVWLRGSFPHKTLPASPTGAIWGHLHEIPHFRKIPFGNFKLWTGTTQTLNNLWKVFKILLKVTNKCKQCRYAFLNTTKDFGIQLIQLAFLYLFSCYTVAIHMYAGFYPFLRQPRYSLYLATAKTLSLRFLKCSWNKDFT